MTLHILSLVSHLSKCMIIKVHFLLFFCASGVAFLRLTVYCFICGRRRVAVARYQMICLVLTGSNSGDDNLITVICNYRLKVKVILTCARKQVNHTSWVAVVTPTDLPKSVRNRFLIELFVALFVLSLCPFDIYVGVGAFVIGLGQISSFLSSVSFDMQLLQV